MRVRAISIALATLLAASATVRLAHAGDEGKAAAEVLFEEGKRLKKEGSFLEAAQKFEQAQRLDPGIGTLLHLGDAYERAGKLASAWANYRDAADLARKARDEREKMARGLADRLDPKLARVRLDLGSNATLPGLVVSRGGVDLGAGVADVAIPVDAGTLVFEVRAAGHATHRAEIAVGDGEQRTVTVPPLEALAEPPKTEGPGDGTPAKPAPPPPPRAPTPSSARTGLRIGALSLGVGALAGAGVAVAFSLRAVKLDDDASAFCSGLTCSDPRGEQLSREALAAAEVATIAAVAGGVAGAGALGLFLGSFAPKAPDGAPSATPLRLLPWGSATAAGASLGGAF